MTGKTRAPTRTEEALLEMLTENTGRHFLDSGGDSDRHWQRNSHRDFANEKPSVVNFRHDCIELTHRVFHWLRDRLEFDEDANALFGGLFRDELDPDGDKSCQELRDEFPSWYARQRSLEESSAPCDDCDGHGCEECDGSGTLRGSDDLYEATGLYGDGPPITMNTYNEPNLLDQTLLFTYFELRSGPGRGGSQGAFVVLQIHGGCDVRGGYTRPKVFQITSDEPTDIFDFQKGTICCAGDGEYSEAHWWSTDDAYHWYAEGACGRGAATQLERYDRVKLDDDSAWRRRALCVGEDGTALCPLCGALLTGGA